MHFASGDIEAIGAHAGNRNALEDADPHNVGPAFAEEKDQCCKAGLADD
jgi:hypothetical protein